MPRKSKSKKRSQKVTLKFPSNWKEVKVFLEEIEPLLKVLKLLLVVAVVIAVLNMKDTIMAMSFDPSLTGLFIWVMLLWLLISKGL